MPHTSYNKACPYATGTKQGNQGMNCAKAGSTKNNFCP